MSSNTPNLDLLKKDPIEDANDTFNIKTMMNDNWDKIDAAVGNLQANGSANDNRIGDRTISDTTAPTSNTGKLTSLLNGFAHMIKSITGGATWRTLPSISLAAIKTILDAATNAATANTMIKRDTNGRAKVAAPSAADDIARKAEVDAAISTAASDAAAKANAAQSAAISTAATDATGKANAVQTNLTTHINDNVKHITAAERTAWNAKANRDGTMQSNLNSDMLQGYRPNAGAVATTVALRDTNGDLVGRRLSSTVATGISPMSVSSATRVNNLNADSVDDLHASADAAANTIAARDAGGSIYGSSFRSIAGSPSGGIGHYNFFNNGGIRFALGLSGIESANNAGAQLTLWAYDNDGGYLGSVLFVNRANQILTFFKTPVVGTLGVGDNSTYAASTAFVKNNAVNALAGATDGSKDPNTTEEPYIVSFHANTPLKDTFWHIYTMFYNTKTSNRAQIAVQYNGGTRMFTRTNFNGAWSAWVEKAPLDSPSFAGTPTVPHPAVASNSTQIPTTKWTKDIINEKVDATVITTGSDLNNYRTEGDFYCPTNASAANIANTPEDVAFHLRVDKHAGVTQTFTVYEAGRPTIYKRNYYNSWGSWRRIAYTDYPIFNGDVVSNSVGSFIQRVADDSGAWARGLMFDTSDGASRMGGLGMYGNGASIDRIFIGHGASPWGAATGLAIKTNGHVGIGLTEPKVKLDVNGIVRAVRTLQLMGEPNASNSFIEFYSNPSSLGTRSAWMGYSSQGSIQFNLSNAIGGITLSAGSGNIILDPGTGSVTSVTPTTADSTTKVATTAHVTNKLNDRVPMKIFNSLTTPVGASSGDLWFPPSS